jgi:hypothetical protein
VSEPWLTRSDSDPRTHALVVGVSRYQFLTDDGSPGTGGGQTFGLRQARTPATSAFRFAKWLESTYNNPAAPLGSVRLLLSPSDFEKQNVAGLDALPDTVLAPTRDNVALAVDGWKNDCATSLDNVGVLYASGHGIQMSPDDGGIVLLEDFARLQNVLDHSLDVGAVRKGMGGPTMAQRQFYFVDACRVRPEEAVKFQTLGNGVGLPAMFEGRAAVSPVFYAAIPSTEALGQVGQGTLFLQALLECLDTALGVDDHVQEDGSWAVTTTTLMQQLKRRVKQLADAHGAEQVAITGGQMDDVPFHVLPGKPEVPITIQLEPASPEAAACARARLWDPLATEVFDGEAFAPTISRTVPAGQYALAVTIQPPTPPFADVPLFLVPALPPSYTGVVKVVP